MVIGSRNGRSLRLCSGELPKLGRRGKARLANIITPDTDIAFVGSNVLTSVERGMCSAMWNGSDSNTSCVGFNDGFSYHTGDYIGTICRTLRKCSLC
jgi:hypothetical protein